MHTLLIIDTSRSREPEEGKWVHVYQNKQEEITVQAMCSYDSVAFSNNVINMHGTGSKQFWLGAEGTVEVLQTAWNLVDIWR